jgi:hypothetical protein
VEWITALMHAADAADTCDYRKADNQHGKKGKLQDKLRKEMGQFRPDSGTAVLTEGRVLGKRVELIVRAWSAGDARKRKDGMNCSMWHALLPQLCAEDALQKGKATLPPTHAIHSKSKPKTLLKPLYIFSPLRSTHGQLVLDL